MSTISAEDVAKWLDGIAADCVAGKVSVSSTEKYQRRAALVRSLERIRVAAQDFFDCWRGDPPIEGSPHDYIKGMAEALAAHDVIAKGEP